MEADLKKESSDSLNTFAHGDQRAPAHMGLIQRASLPLALEDHINVPLRSQSIGPGMSPDSKGTKLENVLRI